MRYILNKRRFHKALAEHGYESVSEFGAASGIHRNTLNLYLKGKSVFASSFDKIAAALKTDQLDLAIPVDEHAAKRMDLQEILPIVGKLIQYDKHIAVILLGSRAKKHAPKSDWDIGITRAGEPIDGREYLKLRSMISDETEDMLHDVDLINIDKAPAWFLRSIDYEPIFLGGDKEVFIHFQGVIDGAKRSNAA